METIELLSHISRLYRSQGGFIREAASNFIGITCQFEYKQIRWKPDIWIKRGKNITNSANWNNAANLFLGTDGVSRPFLKLWSEAAERSSDGSEFWFDGGCPLQIARCSDCLYNERGEITVSPSNVLSCQYA